MTDVFTLERMLTMLGTLYGIGVGPGDPELVTLKAIKVLRKVHHVFAAASSKNDYSLALEIIRDYLPEDTPVSHLHFPMTFNKEHLENAWHANCQTVATCLEEGKDAAFLTLGDPMTFSTFIYLVRKLQERIPRVSVVTVPGITAYQAAAACAGVPLAEAEESLTIISGAKGGERLADVLPFSDNIVLMKTYKHFPKILDRIRSMGLQDQCWFVSRCGLNGQIIENDFKKLTEINPHYLSLMIIKKGQRTGD